MCFAFQKNDSVVQFEFDMSKVAQADFEPFIKQLMVQLQ
jgi:hypothetical protein